MLQRRERKHLNAAHCEIFRKSETGSLGEEIRRYDENNRKDQSTSTMAPPPNHPLISEDVAISKKDEGVGSGGEEPE